jgi:hypothetical protein
MNWTAFFTLVDLVGADDNTDALSHFDITYLVKARRIVQGDK